MQNQGDSLIDERLIQDSLTDHIDRVDATRDLWPVIRDRLQPTTADEVSSHTQEWRRPPGL